MLEKIYLTRHGSRLSWVTDDWESPTGTPRDPPICPLGEQQVQDLVDRIMSLPPDDRPSAIFSCPYYRCLQTSAPVAASLDLDVYLENGISSWYSTVEPGTGLHPRPFTAATLAAAFPEMRINAPAWRPTLIPTRKGETIKQVHDRMNAFFRAFIPRVEKLDGGRHKNILLVAHAATVITSVRELIGDRNLPFRVRCCSLTTLVRQPEYAGQSVGVWQPQLLAEADYICGTVQSGWGFEDVTYIGQEAMCHAGIPGTEGEVEDEVEDYKGNIGLQMYLPLSRM